MNNPYFDQPQPTDAERAAAWSAEAMTEGRLDLGFALARLAVQAARTQHGIVTVPMAGSTRHEEPARHGTVFDGRPATGELARALRAVPDGPTGDNDGDLVRAARAARSDGRRCETPISVNGYETTCGQGAYISAEGSWRHVDPGYDLLHQPTIGTVQ